MTEREFHVYNGEDMSPDVDLTEYLQWADIEFGGRAYLGEAASSDFILWDESGIISASGATLNIGTRNVMKVLHGSNTMWRGRRLPMRSMRGPEKYDRARYHTITSEDYNTDLRGIKVNDFERQAETDVERLTALRGLYLNGSPRATTDLDVTTWVSGSNPVMLGSNTYTKTDPKGVLDDIAAQAGKNYFITVDGEIWYDGFDSTAYATPLKISDRPADCGAAGGFGSDPLCYQPEWSVGPAVEFDGTQWLSGARLYYGTGPTDYVEQSNLVAANQNAHWEETLHDSVAQNATQAMNRLTAILRERQYQGLTYNVSIGPVSDEHVGSLKWGHLIQIKARVIGAANSFISRRIVQLKWTWKPSGPSAGWWAHMILESPHRIFSNGLPLIPQPSDATVPGTDPAVGDLWTWSEQTADFPGFNAYEQTVAAQPAISQASFKMNNGSSNTAPNSRSQAAGGYLPYDSGAGGAPMYLPCTAGTPITIDMDVGSRISSGTVEVRVLWRTAPGGADISEETIFGPVTLPGGTGTHISEQVTPPPTATVFRIFRIGRVDNVTWSTGSGVATQNPLNGTQTCYARCDHTHVAPTMTVAPTPDDDADAGFPTGSFFFEEATGILYVSVDDSTGAAEWVAVGHSHQGDPNAHIQNNHEATAAPTATDDMDEGYAVGSIWVDTTNNNVYVATDVTSDGANWEQVNGAASGASVALPDVSTMHRFPLWAHRGDIGSSDSYPENTVEALRQAILKGADGVEYDVRFTSDAVPVVMHDATMTRTTDSGSTVSAISAATFSAANIDGGFGYDAGRHGTSLDPPTLQQVIDALQPYDCVHKVQLTASSDANATALAEFIVANARPSQFLIEVSTLTEAAAIKAVSDALAVMVNVSVSGADADDNVDWLSVQNTTIVNLAYSTGKAPQRIGAYISIDDFGDPEATTFQDMWDRGAAAFQTNDVDATLALRKALLYGAGASDLDDLGDVAITSPQVGDMLRYNGSAWVNTPGRWEPVTTNPGAGPELVWDGDDILMTWVNT